MNKQDVKPNEMGAYPCKACLRKKQVFYPTIHMITGLAYARCSNPECEKYDPYEFIGNTKVNAIRNWNDIMAHNYDACCWRKTDEQEN